MPKVHLADGAWTIGTPDLVVSSPKMTLPAVAPDFYGRIGPSPTNLKEDSFIKAVEFRERRHDYRERRTESGGPQLLRRPPCGHWRPFGKCGGR